MTVMIEVWASRPVTLAGVRYAAGDPVDTSNLHKHKVGQLLDQRVLRTIQWPAGRSDNSPDPHHNQGNQGDTNV